MGAQLVREPWRPGTLRFFKGIGAGLLALGVPGPAQFGAWSALVNSMLGVAGQNAANARSFPGGSDRSAFLETVAARWEQLDPAQHPFVRGLAGRLRAHDDRDQFLAGLDLILAGIATRQEHPVRGAVLIEPMPAQPPGRRGCEHDVPQDEAQSRPSRACPPR